MRNKNLAIVAILVGVLTILALLWAGNVVAGPPMQEPEGGEEGEVTAEGGIEAQALMDDGFWYQGLLTDGDDNPLANTNVNVTFRIYDVSSGGAALDSVVVAVNTDGNGRFNEEIDFNNHDLFNGQALWLGLQVAGEASEMTPRQYLRPVPYALSFRPGAVISGSIAYAGDYGGAAVAVLNDDGRGIYVERLGTAVGGAAGYFVNNSSNSGLHTESAQGDGLRGFGGDGSGDYGGEFRGWGGVYAEADYGLVLDGANDGDDGTIYSDPNDINSDLVFYTNDEFHVHLDENDDETGTFSVYNGAGTQVFRVHETDGWYGDWSGNESDTVIRTRDNVYLHTNDDNSGSQGTVQILDGADTACIVLQDDGDILKFCGGTSSAAVQTQEDVHRRLYVMESPGVWFEDFGTGQLVNGQATVTIEPLFLETINTDEPYHVFVTPLGDCNGLYVTNKTATSFEVRELGGGTSNIEFDYRIVAKRLGFEDVRMEIANPEELKPVSLTSPADLDDEPIPEEHRTPVEIEPEPREGDVE